MHHRSVPAATMTLPAKPLSTSQSSQSASGRPAATAGPAAVISIRDLKAHCSTCSMRELCLPVGLDRRGHEADRRALSTASSSRRATRFTARASRSRSLYAIRLGSLKTTVLAEDGREQVVGLPHAGRHHRSRRHRHRPSTAARRSRWRTPRSACCRSSGWRISRANVPHAAAQPPSVPVARDLARPQHHAAARQHARRGAPRGLPAQSSPTAIGRAATRRPNSCCA